MNMTGLTGEVVFQLSLTKDEVEQWIPSSTAESDLRFEVIKTPAIGIDLIHLELRIMAFGLCGLKKVLRDRVCLDVDYMIESKMRGTKPQHDFRLQLRLGNKTFLSQLYEPNNYIDRILSGEFSTLKLYLADLVKAAVANPTLMNQLRVAVYNFVNPNERGQDFQAEYDFHNLKAQGANEALVYISVYKMLKQEFPNDAEKMNFHLYSSLMCLRELTLSVKNHG